MSLAFSLTYEKVLGVLLVHFDVSSVISDINDLMYKQLTRIMIRLSSPFYSSCI